MSDEVWGRQGMDRHRSGADSPNSPPHVLREYAFIADGERGGLLGPGGDIAWLCAPRWDSAAVFSSLIGGAGTYTVEPTERYVWGGYYEDGTLIWHNRWTTESGVLECREALSFPGEASRLVLLRRISAVQNEARVAVTLDLRAGFGSDPMEDLRHVAGTWQGRSGPLRFRWSGAGRARRVERHGLIMELQLQPGDHHDLVLEVSDRSLPQRPPDPQRSWTETEQAWCAAVPTIEASLAPSDARRSYAVLRGLTSSTGGMVAAATTSLPEQAQQGRNYDYRYVWIRDQALAGQAVAAFGAPPLLDDAVGFVSDRLLADGPRLAPGYTVDGGEIPDQQSLDLPGYPGGYDRIGNHVNAQFQLDVFGESLLLLAAAADHDHLDANGWRAAEIAVRSIAERRRQPDAGIWELDPRRWTQSRLICAAGLRAIGDGAPPKQARAWASLADTLLAEVEVDSIHRSGRWQRAPDDEGLDAALLLPLVRGLPDAAAQRGVDTMRALLDEFADDHYLYRFRHQPGPLSDAEGAFLLCGFVMAMAQHQYGDPVEAARWFERNRAACGPAGLYAEEYDVDQRQLRGNLPQGFVHAVMMESSIRLGQSPRRAPPG
ncbi:glycoside hydrolase family 15 protein [Microlunatus soli]|nr:glycoside hydrolase family 15 protein [Microlunatus soli]